MTTAMIRSSMIRFDVHDTYLVSIYIYIYNIYIIMVLHNEIVLMYGVCGVHLVPR